MSRQYDAKHHVLKAYPDDREAGVNLFLEYLNVSADDFAYEEGMSPEEYIYGAALTPAPSDIATGEIG